MGRPKSTKVTVRLSVSLAEEDHKAVLQIAEAMGVSAAWVVRRAVAEFITQHSKKEILSLRQPGNPTT